MIDYSHLLVEIIHAVTLYVMFMYDLKTSNLAKIHLGKNMIN